MTSILFSIFDKTVADSLDSASVDGRCIVFCGSWLTKVRHTIALDAPFIATVDLVPFAPLFVGDHSFIHLQW